MHICIEREMCVRVCNIYVITVFSQAGGIGGCKIPLTAYRHA